MAGQFLSDRLLHPLILGVSRLTHSLHTSSALQLLPGSEAL